MTNYGLPYMGSKAGICDDLIKVFPKADNFYDLFGGGFSVTHAMIVRRSKHYKNFHFNEIQEGNVELIKDAIAGKYSYENFQPKWISREDFNLIKDTDFYIRYIWSFGNNGKSYLFGKDIEPYKKSMHNAIVFNDFDQTAKYVLGIDKFKEGYSVKDRRFFLRYRIDYLHKDKPRGERRQLQQLQQLERLQRLQRLQQLQRLDLTSKSYEAVEIKPNSIIYCDIPYQGTADYGASFDHKAFFDWADSIDQPVYISEYNINDDRFKLVWKKEKRSQLNQDKSKTVYKTEKIYGNNACIKLIQSNQK